MCKQWFNLRLYCWHSLLPVDKRSVTSHVMRNFPQSIGILQILYHILYASYLMIIYAANNSLLTLYGCSCKHYSWQLWLIRYVLIYTCTHIKLQPWLPTLSYHTYVSVVTIISMYLCIHMYILILYTHMYYLAWSKYKSDVSGIHYLYSGKINLWSKLVTCATLYI